MNLLDRYIFKSVLFSCLAAVGLFSFVVALANFIRDLLGPVIAGQISVTMLAELIALLFPYAIMYALPAGILTGVLLTLGRISADSEVTAMRAAGIGVTRVARPILLLGVLGAALAVYVNFETMPWARVQYHKVLAVAVRTNPLSFIVPKTFIRDFKGMVVYVGDRPKGGSELRDVWLWKLDPKSRVVWEAHAQKGNIYYDQPTRSFVITLTRAMVGNRNAEDPETVFDKAPKLQASDALEEFRIPLDRYLATDVFHVKAEWLTYSALQAERAKLAAQPAAPGKEKETEVAQMKLSIILHEKLNTALAVFSFALVAVPLGIKVSRRETSANLGIAVMLVLGYYVLSKSVTSLDRHPEYRPDLLLWLPNLIFLWFGVSLMRRVER